MSLNKYVFIFLLLMASLEVNAGRMPVDFFSTNYELLQYFDGREEVLEKEWLIDKLDVYFSDQNAKWYKSNTAMLILLYRLDEDMASNYANMLVNNTPSNKFQFMLGAELLAQKGYTQFLKSIMKDHTNSRLLWALAKGGDFMHTAELFSAGNQTLDLFEFNDIKPFLKNESPIKDELITLLKSRLNSSDPKEKILAFDQVLKVKPLLGDDSELWINESLLLTLNDLNPSNQRLGLSLSAMVANYIEVNDQVKSKILSMAYNARNLEVSKLARKAANQLLLIPQNKGHATSLDLKISEPHNDENIISLSSDIHDQYGFESYLANSAFSAQWAFLASDLTPKSIALLISVYEQNPPSKKIDFTKKINFILASDAYAQSSATLKMNLYMLVQNSIQSLTGEQEIFEELSLVEKSYIKSVLPERFPFDFANKGTELQAVSLWLQCAYWLNAWNSMTDDSFIYFNRYEIPGITPSVVNDLKTKVSNKIKEQLGK